MILAAECCFLFMIGSDQSCVLVRKDASEHAFQKQFRGVNHALSRVKTVTRLADSLLRSLRSGESFQAAQYLVVPALELQVGSLHVLALWVIAAAGCGAFSSSPASLRSL